MTTSLFKSTIHKHSSVGDIWFRSEDGVLFGICQHRIAQRSTVISDMLEPLPLQASPIDIELSTGLLEILLDYVTSLHPKELETNFDDTKALFLACEKWGIEHTILAKFRQRMYDLSIDDPWDLLVWASERDDRHMARAALEKMTPETFARGKRTYWEKSSFWMSLDELPPPWQWRLLRAALDDPTEGVVTRYEKYEWTSRKKMPWKDVSKMFEQRKGEHPG
ncbi:hypothetical protein L486_02189 [Kwoniella mangroviensis CBS 10435]|uniref:BTB domain-containing protein n=1 Tax=Kwoniella mangroviensis CBS 10435 TaxID=1331196 RepID=A0A1B9IVF9_9TREE|nr:hypothetical protein L486_02189 [Kwoniella mangroviensis CBS 10435]